MRMARSTGAVSGLLIALLGIWGAMIPFVGPYFDYSFGANTTWHYTADRLWLNILPGAVALLAGVMLFVAATRAAGVFGGWLGVLAGAWFVVGPAVSLTWEHGPGPIGRPLFGGTRQMLELIGYFYGLGALIVALAAFAIGRFVSRPGLAKEAATPADAPVAVARAEPVPQPPRRSAPSEGQARRPFPFVRRGRAARSKRTASPTER